jgi:hypothetical protein
VVEVRMAGEGERQPCGPEVYEACDYFAASSSGTVDENCLSVACVDGKGAVTLTNVKEDDNNVCHVSSFASLGAICPSSKSW